MPSVAGPTLSRACGRWNRRAGWGDTHRAALVGGALVAHTVIGLILFASATKHSVNTPCLILIAATVIALTRGPGAAQSGDCVNCTCRCACRWPRHSNVEITI